MNLKDLKVVFAGCARDCSNFLPKTLDNIRYYSSLFGESHTVIVENGSVDTTKDILNKNQKKNDNFLFCEQFNKLPNRGQRLENARNLIIETIKNDINLNSCDLFIMLDLDDIGAYRIANKDIQNSINFLFSSKNTAAVFANQLGIYYDIWSLRDQKYCKNDFWVETFKFLMKNKNSFEQISKKHLDDAKNQVLSKKTFSFKPSDPPIAVSSAFGGFGIYKMKNVLENNNRYEGIQTIEVNTKDQKKFNVNYQKCEHVNFNEGLIKQNKKLYILPFLVNHKFLNVDFRAEFALKLMVK